MTLNEIPNDSTGQAIKEIIKNGVKLDLTMDIDFFVVLPNIENGKSFEKEIHNFDFITSLEFDEEHNLLTCYCTKNMYLEYYEIIKIENLLTKVSSIYNGYYDGFGTFGN